MLVGLNRAVSYGSQLRDWTRADNAPPSPGAEFVVTCSTQGSRCKEVVRGNPEAARVGGRILPTKQ